MATDFCVSRRIFILTLLGFSIVSAGSQPTYPQSVEQDAGREAVLPFNIREYTLKSAINGREYLLWVWVPPSYRVGATESQRYPVLYLLDGDHELPIVAMMFRSTNNQSGNEAILVGIGYPPGGGLRPPRGHDGIPFRTIDYTPPPVKAKAQMQEAFPGNGGAPQFLRVIKEEIIPFVDRRYRTTSDRGLHGHSFGGLFATYVLLTDPDVFSRYLITSPSLWWDGESMFDREAAFRKTRTSLNKRVYLSIGEHEGHLHLSHHYRMVSALCEGVVGEEKYYKGLDVAAEVLFDEGHRSIVSLSRALKAIYPPEAPTQPRDPRYCGKVTRLPR